MGFNHILLIWTISPVKAICLSLVIKVGWFGRLRLMEESWVNCEYMDKMVNCDYE